MYKIKLITDSKLRARKFINSLLSKGKLIHLLKGPSRIFYYMIEFSRNKS